MSWEEAMAALHVVMLPLPLQGHIKPMLHLAHMLAYSHGLIITFINTEFNEASSLPLHHNVHFKHISDGLPVDNPRSDLIELLKSVSYCMPAILQELFKSLALQEPPIACFICNSFCLFGQDVAASFNIPYVPFWTQSAASYASVLHVTNGFRPPQGNFMTYMLTFTLVYVNSFF